MFDSQLLAFVLVAAALTLSPGADTMLVMRSVLRGSCINGIITSLGICSGLFFHATLSALGVSIILVTSAKLFLALKFVGGAYLVWLGLQSLRGAWRGATGPAVEVDDCTHSPSYRRSFVEGFVNNLLNPKTAVFYLAFLPQFIGPRDPVLFKSLLLASIHFIMALTWLLLLSLLLDRARRFILSSSLHRWLEGFCGTVLVGLGIRLALEKH